MRIALYRLRVEMAGFEPATPPPPEERSTIELHLVVAGISGIEPVSFTIFGIVCHSVPLLPLSYLPTSEPAHPGGSNAKL